MPRDFATLLNDAAAGDRRALDQVIGYAQEKMGEVVSKFIGVRFPGLRDRHLTHSVLNSFWLDLLEKFERSRGGAATKPQFPTAERDFLAWLRTGIFHNLLDLVRRQGRGPVAMGESLGPEELAADNTEGPLAELLEAERLEQLWHAIDELDETERAILDLRLFNSDPPLSLTEISTRLGVVKSTTSKAWARIVKKLSPFGPSP